MGEVLHGSLLQLLLEHCDFLNIDISQGSVATRLRCGGIFKYELVANLPVSLPVKEFWKSVNIWGSYGQEFSVLFFWDTVYVGSRLFGSFRVCSSSNTTCRAMKLTLWKVVCSPVHEWKEFLIAKHWPKNTWTLSSKLFFGTHDAGKGWNVDVEVLWPLEKHFPRSWLINW